MRRHRNYLLALLIVIGCSSFTESEFFANAVIEGKVGNVEKYIERGFDVEQILPHDNTRKTMLLWACAMAYKQEGDYVGVVSALLDAGADISAEDSTGNRAVAHAAIGSIDVLALVLKRGGDVNHQSNSGYTALMGAVRSGKIENVKFLLAHGANPSLRDSNGKSALEFAVGHPEIVRLLESAAG